MPDALASAIPNLISDPQRYIAAPAIIERLSKDFYWYSPILKRQLDGKHADAVIQPIDVGEIRNLLRFCFAHDIPVTPRGAGTGNYGQAIPLNGGIVLDLSRMDDIEAITSDGVAICRPGVRLGTLETQARAQGWELRCYPSTIVKASIGGFLGGGSGGIGSVLNGNLRDYQTVRALEIVTMEQEPQVQLLEGQAVHDVLHAWGTNGIITKIWLALAPEVDWAQCSVAFDTFAKAYDFSEHIANAPEWTKRLVTTFEWPIPSYFGSLKSIVPSGRHLIFFLIAQEQLAAFEQLSQAAGGAITYSGAYKGLSTRPLLSDYTWNHTTLWAIKHDAAYTYLQCAFDPDRVRDQMRQLRERYGNEMLFHMEFWKNAVGRMIPGALPLVYFTTEERLNDMIRFCRAIGVFVANPHVNNVEDGGRYREDNVQLAAKRRYDPKGLLNPGKMLSFQPQTEGAARP
ncbi:MAG: FAD-binding oxidoreductase [Silvibacterium sp.]